MMNKHRTRNIMNRTMNTMPTESAEKFIIPTAVTNDAETTRPTEQN